MVLLTFSVTLVLAGVLVEIWPWVVQVVVSAGPCSTDILSKRDRSPSRTPNSVRTVVFAQVVVGVLAEVWQWVVQVHVSAEPCSMGISSTQDRSPSRMNDNVDLWSELANGKMGRSSNLFPLDCCNSDIS